MEVTAQLKGLLWKRPLSTPANGRWARRFFVLLDGFLLYYDKEGTMAMNSLDLHPNGVLPLRGGKCESEGDDGKFKMFSVTVRETKLMLAAEDSVVRDEWIKAIKRAQQALSHEAHISAMSSVYEGPRSPAAASPGASSPRSPGALAVNSQASRFPRTGDHVLAYHTPTTCYYFATVVSFDAATMTFTVNWDDGDATGRNVRFDRIALDTTPSPDEVALGSLVIFPQGTYVGTEGNNTGGMRYHQGVVTSVSRGPDGSTRYQGHHTLNVADRRFVFRSYQFEFADVALADLRMPPNALDLVTATPTAGPSPNVDTGAPIDVFLIYNSHDASPAARMALSPTADAPPSYGQLLREATDPRVLKAKLEQMGLSIWCDVDYPDSTYTDRAEIMKRAKFVVACVSNAFADDAENRMQTQFARKTLRKPIVALVVEPSERGPPWRWQSTAIGLLLSGDLYVDFTDMSREEEKLRELKSIVDGYMGGSVTRALTGAPQDTAANTDAFDLFISYCWTNSETARTLSQVPALVGRPEADPRRIADKLKERGLSVWLDTQQMQRGGQLFEYIASGMQKAKAVVVFISDEYANSDNCRMELQFAAKSLKRTIVPVIVGEGDSWPKTVAGLLVAGIGVEPLDLRTGGSADEAIEFILEHARVEAPPPAYTPPAFNAPSQGTHVLAYHARTTCFYYSRVAAFDKETLQYTVNWDDGDTTDRTMPYHQVALDEVPTPGEIAVGTTVIFPQGSYYLQDLESGAKVVGTRYHQGTVTRVYEEDGVTKYDGHHNLTLEQGKMSFGAYNERFMGICIEQLRLPPNAIDAIMAFSARS
eukprot:m.234949 g.234949  ORF g.234949 m.234949 type:complete len:820 (-) comp19846_c0_seq1:142-2601(-)